MTVRLFTLFAVSLFVTPTQGVRAEHVWLDGVVTIIGSRSMQPDAVVVLKSDIDILAALYGSQDDALATSRTRKAVLDELIGEGLIVREAQRVGLDEPSVADLRSARQQLVRQLGGDVQVREVMRKHGILDHDLEEVIQRRAVVAHFLRVNLEDTARVSEAAVRARYDQGDHPFVDQPYAVAAQTLRLWMQQRALRDAVEKWVSVLRTRDIIHQVRP